MGPGHESRICEQHARLRLFNPARRACRYFRVQDAPPYCGDQARCLADEACYGPLLGRQLRGFANESEAVEVATRCVFVSGDRITSWADLCFLAMSNKNRWSQAPLNPAWAEPPPEGRLMMVDTAEVHRPWPQP